ncbi:hypothetical protein BIW11_05213 [Tropilaelaps mercedesae]|uniref:Uncharacterized protein n=1 Tax=Tropilaelaps mercedesae TaxID=418985 RepID=A0A1V9Y365_9ACAR|nr:hypothetical protein BIW11_05213 [Tropilaelaps mercedesae]
MICGGVCPYKSPLKQQSHLQTVVVQYAISGLLPFSPTKTKKIFKIYCMADVRSSIVAASRSRTGWIQHQQQQGSPGIASKAGGGDSSGPGSGTISEKDHNNVHHSTVASSNYPSQSALNNQTINPNPSNRPSSSLSCTTLPKQLAQSPLVQLNGSSCGTGASGTGSTMVHPPPKKLGSKVSSIASLFQQQGS